MFFNGVLFSLLLLSVCAFASDIHKVNLGSSPDGRYRLTALVVKPKYEKHRELKEKLDIVIYDSIKQQETVINIRAGYYFAENFPLYWVNNHVFRINPIIDLPMKGHVDFTTVTIDDKPVIQERNVTHGANLIRILGEYLLSDGIGAGSYAIWLTRIDSGKVIFSAGGIAGREQACGYNYDIDFIANTDKIGLFSKYAYVTERWDQTAIDHKKATMCIDEFYESETAEDYFNRIEKYSLLGTFNKKTKTFEFFPTSKPVEK